ncbi:MAG: isocitrate/isopropylmalate dehydrogenase family protein [Candidatus Omnitrophica bacterium]|nr:isocitrate/isopropylmalate dehydrogenase family protein [Candidatus Omnitrophota bacterium]
MHESMIEEAKQKFGALLLDQCKRVEKMKQNAEKVDFSKLKPIVIGSCWGDGIGEVISKLSQEVLTFVLKDDMKAGRVVIKDIAGLTIENRVKHMKAIPDAVLEEIKSCHVILKGPTTTPQAGDPWPNIESANVAMRRALDLFANVRPVKIPQMGIDWCFFRENTEGAYVLGSKGFDVTEDISVDFTVATEQGSERIIRMGFEYARMNGKTQITIVTKSNIIKTTDGRFSKVAKRIAQEYPGIKMEEWYVDIMSAKLIDPERQKDFQVIILPNLYGDILTDEAAQIQGGVGTAGSANIGNRWSMFEAIHGSAPRMVKEGRAKYADPCSMIRASAMLLRHIGYMEQAEKIEMALDVCGQFEKNMVITGRDTGVTGKEFTEYVLSWINNPKLKQAWMDGIA